MPSPPFCKWRRGSFIAGDGLAFGLSAAGFLGVGSSAVGDNFIVGGCDFIVGGENFNVVCPNLRNGGRDFIVERENLENGGENLKTVRRELGKVGQKSEKVEAISETGG